MIATEGVPTGRSSQQGFVEEEAMMGLRAGSGKAGRCLQQEGWPPVGIVGTEPGSVMH